jgi:aquaporin Z
MQPPARVLRDRRAKPRLAPGVFASETALGWNAALRQHWPEYLIEALLIAVLIAVSVGATALFARPDNPLHVADAFARRALTGLSIGLTATVLIYSPWGRRSGAHMNPAITLAFFRLGKVGRWDLVFYVVAQFAGALAGVLLARAILGPALANAPLSWAATMPGHGGALIAFAAEFAIAALLMLALLLTGSQPSLHRGTGLFAGLLMATFFTLESPLSGFGMNPARTLASAVPSELWNGAWLYFAAPVLGMQLAVDAYRALTGRPTVLCAKLAHNVEGRCIFECQHPDQARANAIESLKRDMRVGRG